MTQALHAVSFVEAGGHEPVKVPRGKNLALHLNASNSPVLFGCRTGICGTCMSRVRVLQGELVPPDADERESLEVNGAGTPDCRLLCQIELTADIEVEWIGEP